MKPCLAYSDRDSAGYTRSLAICGRPATHEVRSSPKPHVTSPKLRAQISGHPPSPRCPLHLDDPAPQGGYSVTDFTLVKLEESGAS